MRLVLIFLLGMFLSQDMKASPQSPDYLIYGTDTFSIYFLPLHHLDSSTLQTFFVNLDLEASDFYRSVNLWRGYQAYWRLVNDSLFLVGLKGFDNAGRLFQSTFPRNYKNGTVFAYWFSDDLAVGKSKMLKWDGIFARTYFNEELFKFQNGLLMEQVAINNYVHIKNGISRIDENRPNVIRKIFRQISKLNWTMLSECDCDDRYLITVDEQGKIGDITLIPYTDNTDTAQMEVENNQICITEFKRILKKMQFDIVTWNGRPFRENYRLELFYSNKNKLENWTD